MGVTIRNRHPSVLHIPDAGLRMTPGQTVSVAILTPQMGALVAQQVLEVITSPPAPEAPPAAQVASLPVAPGRRGGRGGRTLPLTVETAHDAE